MRTTARLDSHNALRWQRLGACENELVFLRINVVRDHVNVAVVAKQLAQSFNQRRFPRANRAADAYPQRAGLKCHDRNNLVYCVSCAMEARSTMNPADPRSSIVASLACALAARSASSSSAMARCPSV